MFSTLKSRKIQGGIVLAIALFHLNGLAQETPSESFRKFPISVGVQFQNFALPLRDVSSGFTHPGLFVGTEVPYNKKQTFFQQASIGGYVNREIGNGIHLNTQVGFRTRIYHRFQAELKAGIGYLRVFHPTQAYIYVNGKWENTTGGKSQLAVPIDFGFRYSIPTRNGELSPFLSYQLNPALFYNATLPLSLHTNIFIGLRARLPKKEKG